MYTERKIHSGLVGTLFLVCALLLLFFHTRPVQSERETLAASRDQLAQEVKALSDLSTPVPSVDGISEVERKDLEKAIPRELGQDLLINDLNRIAKVATVTFNGLTFSLQPVGELRGVTVSAGFQGTSSNIVRFLKLLEVNPRKFVVKNAGISRATNSQSAALDLVNLNITLQAYYQ